jgi:hypothetical protein
MPESGQGKRWKRKKDVKNKEKLRKKRKKSKKRVKERQGHLNGRVRMKKTLRTKECEK